MDEISIEITSKCDKNCQHCSSKNITAELKLDEIINILDQAKELSFNTLSISGGEPILHNEIEKIVNYAKLTGFKVLLYSGGFDIKDKKVLKTLDLFEKQDKVILSLLGVKSHDLITRTNGSFNTVLSSLNYLTNKNIAVSFHTVPMSLNYKELNNISEIVGNNDWHILRLVEQGECKNNFSLALTQSYFKELQEILEQISSKRKISLGHNIERFYWNSTNKSIKSCNLGNKILIKANGDVTYCAGLKEYSYGNIKENSLDYFCNTNEDLIIFKKFINENYKLLKGKCGDCEILDSCKGGCVAQRLIKYNDLFQGPDQLCYKK